MTTIETPRLVIRRPMPKDLESLVQIYSSRACMQFLGGVKTPEETKELFTGIIDNQDSLEMLGTWVLHHKAHNRCVGKTGLNFYNVGDAQEIALDGVLCFSYWGKGLAIELFSSMRDYCFELGLQRIVAEIHPRNTASIKAVSSIFMDYERELDNGNHLYVAERQCWLDEPKSNYLKILFKNE